jgi:hypothetical protein
MRLSAAARIHLLSTRSKRDAAPPDLHADLLSRNGVCPRCEVAPAGSVGVCVICYIMEEAEAARPATASRRAKSIN